MAARSVCDDQQDFVPIGIIEAIEGVLVDGANPAGVGRTRNRKFESPQVSLPSSFNSRTARLDLLVVDPR